MVETIERILPLARRAISSSLFMGFEAMQVTFIALADEAERMAIELRQKNARIIELEHQVEDRHFLQKV